MNELNDILPAADAVVISFPSSPETIGLVSSAQFAAMKSSAVVINVGRGEVIDHPALLSAINSRQIAGAALDVFETEPRPPDSPLWSQSNVIISLHVAGTGGASHDRFAALLWDNINRLKKSRAVDQSGEDQLRAGLIVFAPPISSECRKKCQ
ncbi:MAG: hypothetical protein JXQ99_27190 [Hyphomicrobiaceae bacterium]